MKRTIILILLAVIFSTILGCLQKNADNDVRESAPAITRAPAKSPEEIFISEGFKEFEAGNFEKALKYFEKANSLTSDDSLGDLALTGEGWCKILLYRDSTGINSFLSMNEISSSPAIVGLAYCLLKRRTGNDIKFCIEYLESLGINNHQYEPMYKNMFGEAEVHAMLALAYYWYGDNINGDLQIKRANVLNKSKEYTLVDEINKEIFENGFYK